MAMAGQHEHLTAGRAAPSILAGLAWLCRRFGFAS